MADSDGRPPPQRYRDLISTNPASGELVGRFPVADPGEVRAAVGRARDASAWWWRLGFRKRRERMLAWRALIARRLPELLDLMGAENGKTRGDALVEAIPAVDHVAWSARNAHRVLRPRRVRGHALLPEFGGRIEYEPYGVVGVIGPWNYPLLTPLGSIAYALAAGNAVVFKPSEHAPAVAQWYVDRFAEVVPEPPVLQVVFGGSEVGATLVASGVDKVAFTGSGRTARAIMAACAKTLTPVLIESGGKDALIVDADADLDAAAQAAVFGAMTNAGQTCIGIERAYAVSSVYDEFLDLVVRKAAKLKVGPGENADIGPITVPAQIEIIRRHIADALARGGRAVLGGLAAIRSPFVYPTILVDVPPDAAAIQEETFGPTLTVTRVADAEQALALANATPYGLGGAVFGRKNAALIARRLRGGMVSINGVMAFAGIPALPFGGVGESGFGRIHGREGLREFARPKSIVVRRGPTLIRALTYERRPTDLRVAEWVVRLRHGGPWWRWR